MSPNPKIPTPLCAVIDCTNVGKAHPCPADGGSHGHGRIHYTYCGDHGVADMADLTVEGLLDEHRLDWTGSTRFSRAKGGRS
jgi:hypothetical protein